MIWVLSQSSTRFHMLRRGRPPSNCPFPNFNEHAPFFAHNFQAFLMEAKEGANIPESISNTIAPKTIR